MRRFDAACCCVTFVQVSSIAAAANRSKVAFAAKASALLIHLPYAPQARNAVVDCSGLCDFQLKNVDTADLRKAVRSLSHPGADASPPMATLPVAPILLHVAYMS